MTAVIETASVGEKLTDKEVPPRPALKPIKIPGLRIRTILLTPALADWWLRYKNHENRFERKSWTDYLANQMDNDFWMVNGDTVVFDKNDDMVDGQHRCAMCVKTGESFPIILVEGIEPKGRLTVDDNRLRKFADDLAMNGKEATTRQEDLLRKIHRWNTVGGFISGVPRVGRTQLALMHPKYEKDILPAIEAANHFSRIPVDARVRAFMWWLLSQNAPDSDVQRFFSILAIGSQQPDDRVLITLQTKLARLKEQKATSKEPKTAAAVYYMITGWNAWVTGRYTNFPLPRGGLADPYPAIITVERTAA